MTQLRISLLGPLQVTVDGEEVGGLTSVKIQALLAYLTVERRPHARPALAELLWPERPAGQAAQNLRQSLSRLKRRLKKARAPDCLLSTRHAVALDPDADVWVDVDAFSAAVESARNHDHEELVRCRHCCARLEEAVSLYRGDFLVELLSDSPPFDEWVTLQREALHGEALAALGHLAAHYSDRGDHRAAYGVARRQVELEPWLERGHRQLMRALAGMGRRSEALAAYDSCRQMLADVLSVAPSAQTTALYEAIRQEEIGAKPALTPIVPAPSARGHNLPRQFTPFIGRDEELVDIHERLDRPTCALLTVLGPGGAGKTRLAIEVAGQRQERYRDGSWFVPLAPLTDPTLLPVTIATHLNLSLSGTIDAADQLIDHLRARQLLLLLDNVEHLDDGLDLLLDLMQGAPEVQLLVTSRRALNFRAEWLYEIGGLPYAAGSSPAAALFIQAAQRRQHDFAPEAEAESVKHICRLVEGMPLALELAAAQLPGTSCPQIARTIAANLDYLTSAMRDVPPRQRSLRAVFDSSWNLLTAREKEILPRLALFAGGFTGGAAEEVVGATDQDLRSLLDKSFLRPEGGDRYQMHELLRQFARERLGSDAPAAAAHHADYYAAFAEAQHKLLNGPQQKQALATTSREFENLIAAWQWALHEGNALLLGRFTDGLWAYLDDSGLYRNGLALFERALATATDHPPTSDADEAVVRAWTYLRLAAGFFHQRLGQYPEARRLYEQCLDTYHRLGDLAQCAHCLYYLGGIASNAGELEDALGRLKDSLSIYQRLESERHIANTFTKMGSVLELMGRYGEAEQTLRQALALKRDWSQPLGIANSLNNLALLLWRTGRYEEADALFREALQINRKIGNPGSIASSLSNRARLLMTCGDFAQARELLEESLALEETVQNKRHTAIALNNLGLVLHLSGEGQDAQHYLAQALALARETDNQREEAYALLNLGRILLDRDDLEGAGRALRRTLQLAGELRLTPLALATLVQAARLLVRRGDTARAARLLRQPLHHPAAWHDTRENARVLAEDAGLSHESATAPVAALREIIDEAIEFAV